METGPPVSNAGIPRTIPSVGCNAMVRAALTKMLLHLNDDIDRHWYVEAHASNVQCLMNRRLLSFFKFDVDRRTDDL
jgi:hypothetical protein